MVTWLGIPIGDMEYQCTILGYNQPQTSYREEYNSEIGYLSCYFIGLPMSLRCAIGAFAQTAAMSGNPHQHKRLEDGGSWSFRPPKPLSFTDYRFTIRLTIKRIIRQLTFACFRTKSNRMVLAGSIVTGDPWLTKSLTLILILYLRITKHQIREFT